MRVWAFAVAVVALSLCSSRTALADDPGQDEVSLKGGGSMRGTVVVSEPGKSVEIVVAGQAQPRVIPWSEVVDVQKGKYAPQAPSVVLALPVLRNRCTTTRSSGAASPGASSRA
jgi:hypothetical protein